MVCIWGYVNVVTTRKQVHLSKIWKQAAPVIRLIATKRACLVVIREYFYPKSMTE